MFALNMIMHLTKLPDVIAGLSGSFGAYAMIHRILTRKPLIPIDRGLILPVCAVIGPCPLSNWMLLTQTFVPSIEFDKVSFAYNKGENVRLLLDNFTWNIEPYTQVALVGRSGAGKSSVRFTFCFRHYCTALT